MNNQLPWTTKRPKKPGKYSMKVNGGVHIVDIEVKLRPNGKLRIYSPWGDHPVTSAMFYNVEFKGPIEE